MHILLIMVAVVGGIYFLFALRQFDFLSLSYLAACFYFSPGFWGFTYEFDPSRIDNEMIDETYLVMILVLSFIIISGLIFDIAVKPKKIAFTLNKANYTSHIALLLAVVGFFLTIYQSGSILYLSDKGEILEKIGRWHVIWVVGAGIGAVISFINRKHLVFSLCVLLILADVYVGFRVTIVLSVISIMVYVLSKNGKSRIILTRWKEILLFFFCAVFLLLYKQFYILVKLGEWNLIISRLTDFKGILGSLTRSEPFVIQATLNEVIRNDFHVSIDHLSGIFHNLILFSPNLGIDTISFNSLFQPVLFPDVSSGMASNIWAEMWSTGGWFLLILFIFIYVFFLSIGSILLNISDPTMKGLIVILFSYWSFYVHRNDISYQITLEKRVLLIWLFCVIGSYLIISVLPTRKIYESN